MPLGLVLPGPGASGCFVRIFAYGVSYWRISELHPAQFKMVVTSKPLDEEEEDEPACWLGNYWFVRVQR